MPPIDEPQRPGVHLVPPASPQETAEHVRRQALLSFAPVLRTFTANLLRFLRGSGKPNLLLLQVGDLEEAIRCFARDTGTVPSVGELQEMLDITSPLLKRRIRDGRQISVSIAREAREGDSVIAGALQVAASRILRQPHQARMGDDQIERGVSAIAAIREDRRQEHRKSKRVSSRDPIEL